MKIEKVNEHQIRCTLTREDLANRELKISELAYGTDKAKDLFREMMQQASHEFGFEAEDIPLMIEAVPLNSDCIVLIVTKVDDPEELDTRFSKFAPSIHEEVEEESDEDDDTTAEDSGFMQKLSDAVHHLSAAEQTAEIPRLDQNVTTPEETPVTITRLYSFRSMNDLITLSHILENYALGPNALYKEPKSNTYLLLIHQSTNDKVELSKLSNTITEFGEPVRLNVLSPSYLTEHFDVVIGSDALETLARV
ncbi:MAG: adaptor protein MecA [Lachnospiraceae bacterium]|nr:adaptor protein MecA [Lachnospiraceae bacterium]